MARADGDGEGVDARLFDELFDFFRLRVSCIMRSDLHIVLDAGELAELCLDDDAVLVCVSNDFLRALDVLFELILGAIIHDGRETVIDAGFARLEVRAVIEVQGDRDVVDLEGSEDEMTEIRALCIFAGAGGCLEDDRGLQFSSCFRDTLDDLHVVDVESADGVAALVSFLEHFFRSN